MHYVSQQCVLAWFLTATIIRWSLLPSFVRLKSLAQDHVSDIQTTMTPLPLREAWGLGHCFARFQFFLGPSQDLRKYTKNHHPSYFVKFVRVGRRVKVGSTYSRWWMLRRRSFFVTVRHALLESCHLVLLHAAQCCEIAFPVIEMQSHCWPFPWQKQPR